MPQPSSVIVLVIDRLGAGYLGPYGNTWLETLAFNRLAATSFLCEQMISNSPDLTTVYQAYWMLNGKSLPQLAKAAGYQAVLITDDEQVARLPTAQDFDELHFVKPPANSSEIGKPAAEVEETAFAALIETASSLLADSSEPRLIWIHARAMNGVWDAPLELRQQFGDEDDPAPAEIVQPPEEKIEGHPDPDHLLSLAHAYAGQVSAVDSVLQAFLAAIDELPNADEVLLAVTSPRGYPLGEHQRVGACDNGLFGELLHTPCFLRFPHGEGALSRTQELLQPADLAATIADAAGWTTDSNLQSRSLLRLVRGEPTIRRELIVAEAPHQKLIRTTAWQLRISQTEAGDHYELFAKPDDRWEANDVASRCGDIITGLIEHAAKPSEGELPTELTSPWR
ncbi:sulfatase-like hydrolase/transferase [Anatilimnocola sp. NA78]|uniref:sulfatase-like hydrolase/transferase n=1 Tax=Anatilimnocola sp. NA78 TaxID=3415683 RepID=UPI003CE59886